MNKETHINDKCENIPWILGVILLIGFFIFFGFYSTRTNIPTHVQNQAVHATTSKQKEKVDYEADKDSNHGQDPKIIYGKGNQIRRSMMPSEINFGNNN